MLTSLRSVVTEPTYTYMERGSLQYSVGLNFFTFESPFSHLTVYHKRTLNIKKITIIHYYKDYTCLHIMY